MEQLDDIFDRPNEERLMWTWPEDENGNLLMNN